MMPDPYSYGVLKKVTHERLVVDLERYAKDAGVMPHWIYEPLPDTVTEAEREWLKDFRRHALNKTAGLVLTKVHTSALGEIEQRMSGIAGCLVRNFIRARLLTFSNVLDSIEKGGLDEITCLLIPNFYHGRKDGSKIPEWQIAAMSDLLTDRFISGKQTVLYVADMHMLAKDFGEAMYGLLKKNYTIVGG